MDGRQGVVTIATKAAAGSAVAGHEPLPVGPLVPGWAGARAPARRVFSGRYCRLEPLELAAHADSLWQAHQADPDGRHWTYLSQSRPATFEAFQGLVAAMQASNDPLHWAVIDQRSSLAIGTLSLMRIDVANGVIEVGNVNFSPALQRTPASTEAHWLLMRYVFEDLGYRRYEWKCDSLNAPSRATALRLGFQFEGIFRQAVVYKGRSRDTAWYSLIDREWPEARDAFERWLAPTNFAPDGSQRQRLAQCRT